MTAATPGVTAAPAEPRARLVSPVLVTMLVFIAVGVWSLIQLDGGITVGLGGPGILAWVVWALYGSVAVLIVVAAQRWAHRPGLGILLALAWGGFAATWAAGSANAGMSDVFLRLTGEDPHAWLSTPVIEESAKALGVLGLALIPVLRRFRALDGLFYGVLVGAGFQVVEDGIYTLTALFNDPLNPLVDIVGTVVVRGLTIGVFTHAVYTGLVGLGIGWAASAPAGERGRRSAAAIGIFVLAMVIHGVFNTQDTITPINTAAAIGPFVLLLLAIRWARRDELVHLEAQALANDGWDVLTESESLSIDGPRPAEKSDRRLRDRVRAFAWSADRLGPESRRAKADAIAVSDGRIGS